MMIDRVLRTTLFAALAATTLSSQQDSYPPGVTAEVHAAI